MRTLIAVLLAAACATSMAQQTERPRAVPMKAKDVNKAWKEMEERREWILKVQDMYWNDEWFLDAVDRYAKTGVQPKLKLPKGVMVRFAEHPNRDVLVRHCIGVPGFHRQVYVTKRGNGFVGGSMWLDDDVVPWNEVEIKGRHKPMDGRRMDSR